MGSFYYCWRVPSLYCRKERREFGRQGQLSGAAAVAQAWAGTEVVGTQSTTLPAKLACLPQGFLCFHLCKTLTKRGMLRSSVTPFVCDASCLSPHNHPGKKMQLCSAVRSVPCILCAHGGCKINAVGGKCEAQGVVQLLQIYHPLRHRIALDLALAFRTLAVPRPDSSCKSNGLVCRQKERFMLSLPW